MRGRFLRASVLATGLVACGGADAPTSPSSPSGGLIDGMYHVEICASWTCQLSASALTIQMIATTTGQRSGDSVRLTLPGGDQRSDIVSCSEGNLSRLVGTAFNDGLPSGVGSLFIGWAGVISVDTTGASRRELVGTIHGEIKVGTERDVLISDDVKSSGAANHVVRARPL